MQALATISANHHQVATGASSIVLRFQIFHPTGMIRLLGANAGSLMLKRSRWMGRLVHAG